VHYCGLCKTWWIFNSNVNSISQTRQFFSELKAENVEKNYFYMDMLSLNRDMDCLQLKTGL
jgi:hypothetical protein